MASIPNATTKMKKASSCFICDQEILGAKISLSNSVTTHSSTAIPVKISELMGEDFFVILTGDDYICKRCNVLFNLMDRLQSELNIVQNALLGHIRSKYNLPGMSDTNTSSEIQFSVNGIPYKEYAQMNNLQSTHQKSQLNNSPLSNSVSHPNSLTKTSTNETGSNTTKVYKCGFCKFQSKDLLIVKDHMRGHVNSDQRRGEKRLGSPIAPKPIKRKLFRCQVCSMSYFDRKSCLNHIKANHTTRESHSQPSSSNALQSSTEPQLNSRLTLAEDKVVNGGTETGKSNFNLDDKMQSEVADSSKVFLGEIEQSEPITQDSEAAPDENGTSSESRVQTKELEPETADESSAEGQDTNDTNSCKNVGLDLEAMLAALHSENDSGNSAAAAEQVVLGS